MKKLIVLLICTFYLSTFAIARDLTVPGLEIKGATVSSEDEAKQIAKGAYTKKMSFNIPADIVFRDVSIITLRFNITNFVNKGEKLWQVNVKTLNNDLEGIIWINPNTEQVYFVFGPWKSSDLKVSNNIAKVSMKSTDELKSEFERLSSIVENDSNLWEQVKIVYYEDNHRIIPSSKQLALQELYHMISKSDSTTSAARKALEFFINTDSKDIVRQSFINTRTEIDAWGLMIIASEAVSKTKDEKAIPYLIYTLAKNNYVQIASEDSTIHAIVKQKLITAIKTITGLDIDINKIEIDDRASINMVLLQTEDWAKKHNLKLLDEK